MLIPWGDNCRSVPGIKTTTALAAACSQIVAWPSDAMKIRFDGRIKTTVVIFQLFRLRLPVASLEGVHAHGFPKKLSITTVVFIGAEFRFGTR
ncbi:hypothetical protein AM571_PA00313 (plasmid) [Rhizobium etli 8C-3]|uniref:Uncharacterized protein n=1 Tax=Rhizobium etli 8C-3 TaxID=538025 RepID=A0A1L5PAP4_RHIET|nr:hypothetical protein AM571_PA00313 [Rhizobium etli 8C-3]